MLTNTIRFAIRDIVKSAINAEFSADTAGGQFNTLKVLVGEEFTNDDVAAFVLLFRLKNGLTAVGSEEHLALRAAISSPVSVWTIPNPPTEASELLFPSEAWAPALAAVVAAARQISYNDLVAADFEEFAAAAIRSELGLAGLEDYKLPTALGPKDVTMGLLIAGVRQQIKLLRKADWFDVSVVAEERKPSLAYFDAVEAKRVAEERKARNQKAAAERRAKAAAEHAAKKAAAFTVLDSIKAAGGIGTVDFTIGTFESVKAILGETEFEAKPLVVEGVEPAFVLQYLLTDLAKVHPTWVREGANGDLVLKDSLPKGRGARLSRLERSARIGIYNAIEKVGVEAAVAAINAIWPEGLTGAALARNAVIPEATADDAAG